MKCTTHGGLNRNAVQNRVEGETPLSFERSNLSKTNFARAAAQHAENTVSPIPACFSKFGPLSPQKIPGGNTNMTRRHFLAAVIVLCVVLSTLAPTAAFAQAVYGSIGGTVTDPTGAAVAGAKVRVTNVRKGTNEETATNADGNYSVTHLVPDTYSLKVEGTGFKSFEVKDIIVNADSSARVDGKFEIGGASEVVEVTGQAPQLQTDRSDVSVTFDSKQVGELPILNRNFTSFELLSPGTQRLTGWSHASTENPQGGQQIFVNGQHFSGTAFELDGTDNQDPILGIIIVNPTLESVTEAKITLQNYDAEFGKAVAGVVATQTKSGSNQVHGSAFWFHRDNAGRATDPFSQFVAGRKQTLPKTIWNQFGGSIGGAVIKDKLFFFADYQGTRRIEGRTYTGTVPTALVRSTCLTPGSPTCDLSEYLSAGVSGGGQVYNPFTRSIVAGNTITKATEQGFDPSGIPSNILSLLPAPNATGNANGVLNNFTANGSGKFNDYTFNNRWDYTASQKLSVFGRYTIANFNLSGAPVYGTKIGGSGFGTGGLAGQSEVKNRSVAAGFDYALSSSLLTDFRFGFFQYNPHSTKFDANVAAATALGLPLLNTSDPSTGGLPGFFFDGTLSNFGEGLDIGRCNCPLTERERGYQFVSNWTKIKGNHQIKFGADLRHATNLRTPSDANRTGLLRFSHNLTSDGVGSGGLDLASFLFAGVNTFNRYVGSAAELGAIETQNRYFIYGQDTWRVTPKLTVNYGLRYEIYTPESVSSKNAGGFAVLPEGNIRVAGNGGISSNGNTRYATKAFAPRLGVAYQVGPKTVVRLGYGRSFDIGVFGSLFGHTVTQNLPVLANQNLFSPDNGNTSAFDFTTGKLTSNGNDITYAFPVIPPNGILPLRGPLGDVTPHVRPDIVRLPTLDAWNATVQHQIDSKTSLEVSYVANKATHGFVGNGPSYNVNTPSIAGFFPGRDNRPAKPFFNKFSTPYTDANGVTTTVICCDGDLGYAGNDGNSFYRALQVKVDRRLSSGLQVLAHYTYSRAYNYNDNYNPDRNVVYGRDDFSRDSVFVATALYELPFGKGKKFLNNSSKAADLLLGGWQWNSTWTIGSGLPWTPSYSECGADQDTGPCRPSIKGSYRLSKGKFDPVNKRVKYFEPVAALATNGAVSGPFIRPAQGAFGNVQRNSFTGPGEFMSDMSIFKGFSFTERVKAQLRFEFFNVFNHAVIGYPGNGDNNCIDCTGGNNGYITKLQEGTQPRQMQLGLRISF